MLRYKSVLVLIGLIEMLMSINAQSGTNSSYCWNNANTITTNWTAPNPFNDALVLNMDLIADTKGSIIAYDMVGHLVENIQVPTAFAAGEYKLTWNASNLPAGLYFVTLQGNDFRKTIKVIKQ